MRDDGDKDEMPDGYFLGFYAFNGADEMTFTPLDADKVNDMIKAGKVKGVGAKRKYDFVTLTGSPAEIAAFLGSPEAQEAGIDDPAVLHRLR